MKVYVLIRRLNFNKDIDIWKQIVKKDREDAQEWLISESSYWYSDQSLRIKEFEIEESVWKESFSAIGEWFIENNEKLVFKQNTWRGD